MLFAVAVMICPTRLIVHECVVEPATTLGLPTGVKAAGIVIVMQPI